MLSYDEFDDILISKNHHSKAFMLEHLFEESPPSLILGILVCHQCCNHRLVMHPPQFHWPLLEDKMEKHKRNNANNVKIIKGNKIKRSTNVWEIEIPIALENDRYDQGSNRYRHKSHPTLAQSTTQSYPTQAWLTTRPAKMLKKKDRAKE